MPAFLLKVLCQKIKNHMASKTSHLSSIIGSTLILSINLTGCLSTPVSKAQETTKTSVAQKKVFEDSELKGWGNLANLLIAQGYEQSRVIEVIQDPRMPVFQNYEFNVVPREPSNIYQGFSSPARIQKTLNFMRSHAHDFARAETHFDVDAEVIAAIISVESDLGKNTGRHIIFYRLARLANCNDENNVSKNYARLKQIDSQVTFAQVQARAKKLEQMFLPEVTSILDSCDQDCDLFKLIGSPAGAFGIPQFLPSSYQKFAVDFNNNQQRTLFEVSDSVGSIGNYLKNHGWSKKASDEDKKKAIWHYNHSQPYVDTVFQIYKELVKARARSCRVC